MLLQKKKIVTNNLSFVNYYKSKIWKQTVEHTMDLFGDRDNFRKTTVVN